MDLYFSRGSGITVGCHGNVPRTEQDPRDTRIEEQEREIARLREELTRVEGDRDQWKRDRDRWKRRSEHLKQQLDAARRAGFRQAAPFAKDRPQGRGGRPGRRAGAHYGRQACRPRPAQVDETCRAPAPAACPDCGGAVELSRVATQYQEDLPVVRPIVRRFDIEVGHCSQCRRRVQGRHRLQTSDALGAAGVQTGSRSRRAGRAAAHAPGRAAGEGHAPAPDPVRPDRHTGRPRAGAASHGSPSRADLHRTVPAGAGISRGHAG